MTRSRLRGLASGDKPEARGGSIAPYTAARIYVEGFGPSALGHGDARHSESERFRNEVALHHVIADGNDGYSSIVARKKDIIAGSNREPGRN